MRSLTLQRMRSDWMKLSSSSSSMMLVSFHTTCIHLYIQMYMLHLYVCMYTHTHEDNIIAKHAEV